MFIPIFIAVLMGLISPANYSSNSNSGGTVYVNGNSGEDDPGAEPGGEPGDDDTGIGGPGPANPGGGSGQNPPPKIP